MQEELGDGYRVLNLAMNGAYPAEFGGTAAEMLAQDFPRLIFVSDVTLGCAVGEPPSAGIPAGTRYRYFFWDAYFKGLLPPQAGRDEAVAAWLRGNTEADAAELTRGLRLDTLVSSRNLWTTLGYRHLFTVWCSPLLTPFTRPRRNCADAGEQPAVAAARHTPAAVAAVVAELRAEIAIGNRLRQSATACGQAPNALLSFPPVLQGRTLLVLRRGSPDYVRRLRPEEQADYRAAFPAFRRPGEGRFRRRPNRGRPRRRGLPGLLPLERVGRSQTGRRSGARRASPGRSPWLPSGGHTVTSSVGQAAGLPRNGRPAACPTPAALLLGVVCTFVACCVAGRVAVRHNCFADFQRFHPHITPQTLFYPTASQVRHPGP